MRTFAPLAIVTLVACNPGGSFDGRLVDAMTSKPRSDIRVLAKAESPSDMTCQVREATTDATGTFHIDNTCPDTTYDLVLGDDTLRLADAPKLTGGQKATGTVDLSVWRAPAGTGIFKLKDDTLTAVRTFSDVGEETVLGTAEKVRYPTKKPLSGLANIDGGSWLVIGGKNAIDRYRFLPLEPDTGVRNFENGVTIEDHVYIGVKFTSDTEFTRTDATLDESKIKNVTAGDRMVRYIASEALLTGRYAVLGDDDKRTFVIDFGDIPAPAASAE